MKHPTPEEWMSYLYREDTPTRHGELHTHLQGCQDCLAQVRIWRGTMQSLDQWPDPAEYRPPIRFQTALKWAAAAALVLGLGFSLGRGSGRSHDNVEALRASLARDFDQKLALIAESSAGDVQRLLTEFVAAQEERRVTDQQTIISALRTLDAKYAANLAVLRTELETVAVNTEDGLSDTHQQLNLLASSYAQPMPPQSKSTATE